MAFFALEIDLVPCNLSELVTLNGFDTILGSGYRNWTRPLPKAMRHSRKFRGRKYSQIVATTRLPLLIPVNSVGKCGVDEAMVRVSRSCTVRKECKRRMGASHSAYSHSTRTRPTSRLLSDGQTERGSKDELVSLFRVHFLSCFDAGASKLKRNKANFADGFPGNEPGRCSSNFVVISCSSRRQRSLSPGQGDLCNTMCFTPDSGKHCLTYFQAKVSAGANVFLPRRRPNMPSLGDRRCFGNIDSRVLNKYSIRRKEENAGIR